MSPPKKGNRSRKSRPSQPVYFAEQHVDGFVGDEPHWLAYCQDREARLPQAVHEECPYCGGIARDEAGEVVAVRCTYRGRR